MFKIGLTGGICSGKTFILNIFKELECYTVRADDIAKKILFSNDAQLVDEVKKVFGESVYNEKEGLIKEEFSRLMFESAEKRNFVNNLVHPLVKAERGNIIESLDESEIYDFFVYESALLVESGIYKDFDKIIVVYTNGEEQMRRLMERDNITTEAAEARIKAQFPLSEKLKVANYAIDTTGSFESAHTKALETFHLIKKELMQQ
ncbi:MAG: dephospho-CoA kinase [bacterium]|nr:dephospho-CoA kinase [bacterium]